jgi:hypothetical protein
MEYGLLRIVKTEEKLDMFGSLLSAFGPAGVLSQRVNQMLRVPNLDGDARRVHGGLSWFGQKKALRPAERGEYCIFLHLSACVGVTSCERGNRAQVSEKS